MRIRYLAIGRLTDRQRTGLDKQRPGLDKQRPGGRTPQAGLHRLSRPRESVCSNMDGATAHV
jgi:hypothetical protein